MSIAAATEPLAAHIANHNEIGNPPSLRRRAPLRIDICLKSGRGMQMTGRKVHLRSGESFVLTIVPQKPSAIIEIATEAPLHRIVSAKVDGDPLPSYYAEISGHVHLRFPIPITSKLYISVADGLASPFQITIPVKVWPGLSAFVVWWVMAFVGIIGVRLERAFAHHDKIDEIYKAMLNDLSFLLGVFLLGFVILIPIRWIGWLISLIIESCGGTD